MMAVNEYPIEGHLADELTRKFNEVYANHVGYVPRSPSLWLELYRNHLEAHLLVAEKGKKKLGYVIVALQDYVGAQVATISEFCVWENQSTVLKALLDRAESYAQKMNACALAAWNTNDEKTNETFEQQGFISVGRSVFSVGVISLDFLELMIKAGEKVLTTAHSEHGKEITVDLSGKKLPSYSGTFRIRINSDGRVSINEGKSSTPYASVKTDIVTFTEIVLGIRNLNEAVLLGEIRIVPFWKAIRVIGLLRPLVRRPKWHTPLGDFF